MCVTCPGDTTEITPAQRQASFEVLFRLGWNDNMSVGAPGAQGAGVLGMHGIGVKTPSAAEVAAATVGLARLMHMPNGITFIMGTWSMMLAAG